MAEITLHSNVAQKMQELSKRRTESQQRPDLSKLDPPRLPPLSETPSSPKPPESPKNLEQILLKPSGSKNILEPVEQPEKKKKKRKVRKLKWKKVNKTKLSMNESSMFSSDSQVSSLNESLANSKLNTTKKRRIRKVKKIRKKKPEMGNLTMIKPPVPDTLNNTKSHQEEADQKENKIDSPEKRLGNNLDLDLVKDEENNYPPPMPIRVAGGTSLAANINNIVQQENQKEVKPKEKETQEPEKQREQEIRLVSDKDSKSGRKSTNQETPQIKSPLPAKRQRKKIKRRGNKSRMEKSALNATNVEENQDKILEEKLNMKEPKKELNTSDFIMNPEVKAQATELNIRPPVPKTPSNPIFNKKPSEEKKLEFPTMNENFRSTPDLPSNVKMLDEAPVDKQEEIATQMQEEVQTEKQQDTSRNEALSYFDDIQSQIATFNQKMEKFDNINELIGKGNPKSALSVDKKSNPGKQCAIHPSSVYKFFCRDCKVPICVECINKHADDNFVRIDDLNLKSSEFNEVAVHIMEALSTCEGKIRAKSSLRTETQSMYDYLQEIKKDEQQRIRGYFEYIRMVLDKREETLRVQLDLSIGILEKRLNLDLKILDGKMADLKNFNENLKKYQDISMKGNLDIALFGEQVYDLIESIRYYDQVEIPGDGHEQPNIPPEEMIGDHLFMVQIDNAISLPYFDLNLSPEIERLKKIGMIKNQVPILDIEEEEVIQSHKPPAMEVLPRVAI
ncbi:unnamed protein product [Moneuplotes crassus]|uniref:B box-type domain-containing protein n=1 Tax=Euplotes crassus TaxID=5936 RepID=A0AAD1YA25_EUPCR|nr:unnamed protein product [Moneuplotes crassus]